MPNPEATIDIVANDAQFIGAAKRVTGTIKKVKDRMKELSLVAKGVFVVQAGFFAKAIKDASEYEDTISKMDAVWGDNAQAMQEWAKSTADSMNRGRTAISQYVTGLQDTLVPMGLNAEQAQEMSKALTRLAVDQESFSPELGTAKDNIASFTSALIGSHEAVAKFGVIINEQVLNQELVNMGLKEGAKNATVAQKAQARYNLIMRMSTAAQGDAERTSGSFANQMRGMMASIKEVSETIGGFFLPGVTRILVVIKKVLDPIKKWIAEHQKLVMILSTVVVGVTGFLATIAPLVVSLGLASGGLGVLAGAIATVIGLLSAKVIAITALVGSIATVIGSMVNWSNVWQKLRGIMGGIFDWMKGAWAKVIDALIWGFAYSQAVIKNWSQALRAGIFGFGYGVIKIFNDVVHFLTKVIPAYLGWFRRNWVQVFLDVTGYVAAVFKNMWKNIKNFFGNIWKWLKGDKTAFKWTALSDGFEATMKEDLPEIAERGMGNLEKYLYDEMNKSAKTVAEEAGQIYSDIKGKMEKPGAEEPGKPEGAITPPGEPAAAEAEKEGKGGAGYEGLQEAFKRIADAAAGRKSPEIMVAEEQLEEQKKMSAAATAQKEKLDVIVQRIEKQIQLQEQLIAQRQAKVAARLA